MNAINKLRVGLLAVLLTTSACGGLPPPDVDPPPPRVELCDDQIDNDGDGLINENPPCVPPPPCDCPVEPPPPPPPPLPDSRFHQSNFLSLPGYDFLLRYPYWDDATRAGARAALRDRGLTDLHALVIEDDAASQINLYADPQRARQLATEAHASGLRIWFWLLPETQGVVNAHTPDVWREMFAAFIQVVDDVADGYVMGLETTEYWTEDDLEAAVARVRSHTSKPIATHGVQGYVYRDSVYRAGVTHHFHQYWHGDFGNGFLSSTDGVIAETSTHAGRLATLGVSFVGFEYALRQPDNLTEPVGRAALEYGSVGYGNGGPRDAAAHYRPPDSSGPVDQIDPHAVSWNPGDWNIANWNAASRIIELKLTKRGDEITIDFPHTKAGQWPVVAPFEDWAVEGNVHVCARPVDATWHCATFEWLRPGSISRTVLQSEGFGPSIRPGTPLTTWHVQPGEEIAILVSTVTRFGPLGPVNERSNIVRAIWP